MFVATKPRGESRNLGKVKESISVPALKLESFNYQVQRATAELDSLLAGRQGGAERRESLWRDIGPSQGRQGKHFA